jgi:3-methyladenine DNA glycosylase/8-oxoguanine DNA glycosylase
MQTVECILTPLPPFDFGAVIDSHGWVQLAPFSWDADSGVLSRPEHVEGGVVEVRLRGSAIDEQPAWVHVEVMHAGDLTEAELESVRERVSRSLSLNRDLSEFHRMCQNTPGFESVLAHGKGRLLLGSTLFEDVVKTILTTNVNWAGTRRMVARLVDAFGSPLPWEAERRAFPTVEQIADGAGQILRDGLGLGYRGPYIVDLARRIRDGDLDLSRWENGRLDSGDLYRELRAVKGIGDYAASSISMLLGHTERIPVDSWARKLISTHFYAGEPISDGQAAEAFAEFGRWRGMAFWFYDWNM